MRGREEGGEREKGGERKEVLMSDYVKIVSATLWIETTTYVKPAIPLVHSVGSDDTT